MPVEESLLDTVGRLKRPVTNQEVRTWKQQLGLPALDRQRAGWLHLWLGEWQLGANEQPETALQHFLQAQKLARPTQRLAGRAALDRAIALEFEGAYSQAAEQFHRLLLPKSALPGYDIRNCAMWYRHATLHAGYHAQRANLGITEPPRLDPLCGAASLAACLRALDLPSDKKTLLSVLHITGEGSSAEDIVAAGRKLGLSAYKISADDTGLKALPKPLVAYVERDHFVAVVRADNNRVSYLCSDCGAWPGGRRDLTWEQWHAMDGGLYIATARRSSPEDKLLASLRSIYWAGSPAPMPHRGLVRFHHRQVAQSTLLRHAFLIRSFLLAFTCGGKPGSPHCTDFANCCDGGGGGGGGGNGGGGGGGGGGGSGPGPFPFPFGPSSGDPVNPATGEEEYRPQDDLVVYNPQGPAVHWGRVYGSLRQIGDGYIGGDTTYQCNDFGVGWSQHYNVGVYDPTGGNTGTKYVLYENGSRASFTASTKPSAGNPRIACATQPGAPLLVEWDYDPNNTSGYYTITFSDRTQWITTDVIPNVNGYALAQLRDRVGNSLYCNYTPPPAGFDWPLLASISTGPNGTGTTLLSILRTADGTGNIAAVSDVYGRSVYYHSQYYSSYGVSQSYQQFYQELESVSEIVQTATANAPVRDTYGYQLLGTGDNVEQVRFLHTITVPSPEGTGSSTATINYTPYTCLVSSLVDGNGNIHAYTYVDTAHTQVTVETSANVAVYSYTVGFNTNMSMQTLTNGAGAVTWTLGYSTSAPNPYQPTSITDGNGNTWNLSWDQFGNMLTMTRPSPRNTVTTYSYDYSVFPMGELKSIQEGAKSPTTIQYYEPSGLIKQLIKPLPGTSGSSSTVTFAYTYNSLGDPLTITDPGNNSASSITTTFSYGSSPAVGEPLTITDNLGKAVILTYDNLGLPASFTDQANNTISVDRNLAGQPTVFTFPATGETGTGNSAMTFGYLYPGGPPLSATTFDESDQQVRQIVFKYGKEGEMLSRSGSDDPVTYTYDAYYRLHTLADGAGHKTTYAYNTAGYLASVKYPKGDTVKFTAYDPLGDVLTRVDGRNITTKYVYNDPENLLTNINYPADTTHDITFGYDAYGRRTGIADGTGSQTISYDDDDLTTSVKTTYNGLPAQTIAYSYYPNGSRQGMSTPAGNFAYQYTGNGLLQSLVNPFNETTNWSYTDNRLMKTVTLPNGVTGSYGYDPRNRPTSLTNKTFGGTVLSSFTGMAYDAASNRASMTASMPAVPANGGLTTYTYDSKNQLTQEQSARAGSYTDSFAYDSAENPTTFRGAANTFNTDNQFTNSGYAYDGSGNPTTYQGVGMSFDEENRLTGVGSSFAADYTGAGLRAWKQGSGGPSYFLYDGTFPVCELDASGNVQAVNTSSTNGLISRRTSSSKVFYTFDPQGNAAQRLDTNANVLSSSVYDGFGAAKAGGPSSDPFGFGAQFGYYTDVETGLQLLTHRYYDAGTGRFLTRDPISYMGGINVYAYVQNRALFAHDPSGTSTVLCQEIAHDKAFISQVGCGFGSFVILIAGMFITLGFSLINPIAGVAAAVVMGALVVVVYSVCIQAVNDNLKADLARCPSPPGPCPAK